MVIRIAIADDHPAMRRGIRQILSAHPDLVVVGEAGAGAELLDVLATATADVVVLDVSMPGMPFLELMSGLVRRFPRVRILVVSMHPEGQYATRALRAGAAGYVEKSRSDDEIVAAIRQVHRGGRYISPTVADQLVAHLQAGVPVERHEALSRREFEVLALLGAGRSAKEIAALLRVSAKTIATYRARLTRKLGLTTTGDLIRYAVEHGLVS